MNNVISIESNSGMMGGKVSHEFMAIAECGEDTVFVSPDGKYRANKEVAVAAWNYGEKAAAKALWADPVWREKMMAARKKRIDSHPNN